MNGLVVVSDVSVPANDGLHEQLLLTVEVLALTFDRVDVRGFTRHPVDAAAIRRATGVTGEIALTRYSGSVLNTALRSLVVSADLRRLRDRIRTGSYDLVLLDGPLGAAAYPRGLAAVPVIMSWVDPGSRRFGRRVRTAHGWAARISAAAAAIGYRLLEHRMRSARVLWHVVSASDAVWLRRRFPGQPVVQVPVMLPREETDECAERRLSGAVIACDLRYASFQAALHRLLAAWDTTGSGGTPMPLRVVGRVTPEAPPAFPFDVEYVSWVPSLDEEFRNARVVLLIDPDGTGLKNRTVQAVCSGAPVIGTSSAFEGIPPEVRAAHRVVSGAEELPAAVEDLLAHQRERRAAAAETATLARRLFGRSTVTVAWRSAYEEAAAVLERAER